MSRYVNVIQTGVAPEQAQQIAEQYLQGEGFNYVNEAAGMVWRKGVGAMINPQFFQLEYYADGSVKIDAWMAAVSAIPGVYGGETDPTQGIWGWAVKAQMKPRIAELERRLTMAAGGGQTAVAAATSGPAAGWFPDPAGKHEQRYWDGSTWTADVNDAGQSSTDPLASV